MTEPRVLLMQPFPLPSPPFCSCWGHLWLLLKTVCWSPTSPGPLNNTPGQRVFQASDEASRPASPLFLSASLQPGHCIESGKRDFVILSLGHLLLLGDFLPLLSSSSNIYGPPKIYKTSCLEQGVSKHFL